ncbi:MAG: Glu/Leu/Phe/Val dehydrogenase [Deltaproteobacteria bacterium]|nr:Glu/Leu/Phe/Val dehydrogenase [Deltaproteobacteria bacterium]
MNAGGTRLAPDVSEDEARLLARAMTYKFAALGLQMGGAKAVVRGAAANRAELMARFCEEIRPLVASLRFLTGPDIGTSEEDFAPLRRPEESALMRAPMDGVAFEDLLTGFGVIVAAERALGSLAGRSIAVEGFGKVGGGVVREAARRGARVVAVSTLSGCARRPEGFAAEALWELRAEHGDDLVRHLGVPLLAPAALFEAAADVLVPGARIGVIDAERARRLRAGVVAPAANVPYVAGVPEILRERGILALPDFVCNAGAVIGYVSTDLTSHRAVLELVERRIRELVGEAMRHPAGPFAGGCALAEGFLRTWRPADGMPAGPPVG